MSRKAVIEMVCDWTGAGIAQVTPRNQNGCCNVVVRSGGNR
jgi:hypothetical protein